MDYRLRVQIKEDRCRICLVSANVQIYAHFDPDIADNAKQWNSKRGESTDFREVSQ